MLQEYQTFKREKITSHKKHFLKNNNETNKKSKIYAQIQKRSSAWRGLQSKTVNKNSIFYKIR